MRALLAGFFAFALTALIVVHHPGAFAQDKANAPNTQINYDGFRSLTGEVEAYRANRLVPLAEFNRMAREPSTLILDARSADAYAQGHIEGAVNLPFTDFTDQSLRETLRDPNVRILIYCNNNFQNAEKPFPAKMAAASLNLSTYIALYTYGYRNVYELGPLLDIDKSKIEFETAIRDREDPR